VIAVNSLLSDVLASRGIGWESTVVEFAVMAAANIGIVWVYLLLAPRLQAGIARTETLFFVLLLTLIVTLYDRYRPVYDIRFGSKGAEAA
jgi:hypothetical protein